MPKSSLNGLIHEDLSKLEYVRWDEIQFMLGLLYRAYRDFYICFYMMRQVFWGHQDRKAPSRWA